MRKAALVFLLLFAALVFSQDAEESMYWELFGVLSYLGVLLLSFLFALIAAIPFVEEVMGKKEVDAVEGPTTDRRIWVIEAIVGLFLVSLTLNPEGRRMFDENEMLVYIIAAICALLPFVIFALMAFISNIYRRNLLKNIFSLMLWGVFAGGAALFLNQSAKSVVLNLVVGPGTALVIFTIITAFFEEALKGLGLAQFIKNRGTPKVLGMLYGFSIGVGFSMLENWLYFSYGNTPFSIGVAGWTQVLFYRSFFTTMAHGFFVAFNAFIVCSLPGNKSKFGLGLLTAFILHLSYNSAVISNLGLTGPFIVLGLAFVFLYLVYSEMKRETGTAQKKARRNARN